MGKVREPAIVVVLWLVTLGIYGLYYWWVVSKEIDAYMGKPGHAHRPVRNGTLLAIVTGAIFAIVVASIVAAAIAAGVSRGQSPRPDASFFAAIAGLTVSTLLVAVGFVLGLVMISIGMYRTWEAIEADERQRGLTSPISAGLMLALSIAAWLIPFIGFVLGLAVPYLTQQHLNKIWATRP